MIDPEKLYDVTEKVDETNLGAFFRAVDRKTKVEVSIHIILISAFELKADDEEETIEQIRLELDSCRSYDHPNVLKCFGAFRKGEKLWIVTEHLPGGISLEKLVKVRRFDEQEISVILSEVLLGVEYLHGKGVTPCYLKGKNVVLNDTGELKLRGHLVPSSYSLAPWGGPCLWSAPEVIRQNAPKEPSDVWSLGIVTIELATGAPPHFDVHPMRALFIILKSPPPELEGRFTHRFKDIIRKCLLIDPNQRPTVSELLRWFTRTKHSTSLLECCVRRAYYRCLCPHSDDDSDDDDIDDDDIDDDDEWESIGRSIVSKPPTITVVAPAQGISSALVPMDASALNRVIFPTLSRVMRLSHLSAAAVESVARLKIAFDNLEKARPQICNTLVSHLIDCLKKLLPSRNKT